MGEILLFLRKRNVHGKGCESKKSKFAGNARAREETCRLFSSSFHPREEQTRMCSFHQSAMRITGENTHIAISGWQNKDHTKKKVHFSSIFYLFRAFASHIL